MAGKLKGAKDVNKFGGTEKLGDARLHGDTHEVSTIEVQSKTRLEADEGFGNAAIIRCFEFGMNPSAFHEHIQLTGQKVSKQEIFNAHSKGIEIALWKDGMKVIPEVAPRVLIDDKLMKYQIFVGAAPMKGHRLLETPKTLTEIAHG